MDRPPDGRWDTSGTPDAIPDMPQHEETAASQDRGTVLTDARTREEYALAYRSTVDAIYRAAEQRTGPERPVDPPGSIHDTQDMADQYPGDCVPWAGPQRLVEQPEALGEWLADANPDKTGPGRWNNCGECARAVARTWFGDAATSAALVEDEATGEPTRRMTEWTGQKPVPASMGEIGRRLAELGAGSLAISRSPCSHHAAGPPATVTVSSILDRSRLLGVRQARWTARQY
jgi:hypothetical protein